IILTLSLFLLLLFFFFTDTAPTEIYPLSLHDALPIYLKAAGKVVAVAFVFFVSLVNYVGVRRAGNFQVAFTFLKVVLIAGIAVRSEEHTSELQSLRHLVCRLLLEKKKIKLICIIIV